MNLDDMIKDGWRQCAKGQRTTQYCDMLQQAVEAEREACLKIAEGELLNHALFSTSPMKSVAAWKIINAIRARGDVPKSRQPSASDEKT